MENIEGLPLPPGHIRVANSVVIPRDTELTALARCTDAHESEDW